ncbi:MAG: hypothetical protein L3J23_09340, partial [Flavobacteriaceae bacterium]|nr:hypothetical protein [Flavobacteriaceae bacterium]
MITCNGIFSIFELIVKFEMVSSFNRFFLYKKSLKDLKQYHFKHLVVFGDMQPLDNIIVQYFKNINKSTTTMAHGLYIDFLDDDNNISSIQNKIIVSDYFLAWGKENQKLVNKYNRDCKAIVCGNPLIQEYKIPAKIKNEFFTVLFDWDIFEKENKEMLNLAYFVAKKLKIKISIRFHPSNNKNNYIINNKYIINDVDYRESKFIIGHTSSMIHISQRLGIITFKYDTDIPVNPVE